MDTIPLLDLTLQYQALSAEIMERVQQVMASGQYINGPVVRDFEAAFAQFMTYSQTTPEVISCNSGTDALYLALKAQGIGPGDEVITSAFSFFASAEVISLTGAQPVFVDIDPLTFNLDLQRLSKSITPRTRAIIPVHLFGQPLNMTAVMQVAQEHQLAVIEDCAQAVGACWQGRKVGVFGQAGCFSFFPTKNLGAMGDGGAVVTTDRHLADRIRSLKNHGQSHQYKHEHIGVNSRMDAMQAAILSVKLPYLREWNWRRRGLAESYRRLLQGIPDLVLPEEIAGGTSVWHQFTLRVGGDEGGSPSRRDRVLHILNESGIQARVYYPIPIHLQPAYQGLGYQQGDLPQAERCAAQVLSLPCFPELTVDQQQRVASSVRYAMQATVPAQILD